MLYYRVLQHSIQSGAGWAARAVCQGRQRGDDDCDDDCDDDDCDDDDDDDDGSNGDPLATGLEGMGASGLRSPDLHQVSGTLSRAT